jgi:hypothetical protein
MEDQPARWMDSSSTLARWNRRRVMLGGAGAAVAALAGCATGGSGAAPIVGPNMGVPAAVPRVGDTWRYRYSSAWAGTEPIRFSVQVTAVTPTSITDALSVDGSAGQQAMTFTGRLEFAVRALAGLNLTEFAPYVQAFVPLVAQNWSNVPVAIGATAPQASWARAQVQGVDTISTVAGTFAAARVELSSQTADSGQMRAVAWFAPVARRWVRMTYDTWDGRMQPIDRATYELLGMTLGG